jgi:hypothetical protein
MNSIFNSECPLELKLQLREKFDEGFMEKTQSIDFSMKGQGEKKGQTLKRKRKLFIGKIATQDIRVFVKDEQVDPHPPPIALTRKSQVDL